MQREIIGTANTIIFYNLFYKFDYLSVDNWHISTDQLAYFVTAKNPFTRPCKREMTDTLYFSNKFK